MPTDPATLVERWRYQPPAPEFAGASFSEVRFVDIFPEPGLELVTSAASQGSAKIIVLSAGGEVLLVSPGRSNLVADFTGDGRPEHFAMRGDQQQLLGLKGDVLWESDTPQGMSFSSAPLLGDITGDGLPDVVLAGRIEEDPERPVLWAVDGPSGDILFEHELPCGHAALRPVGLVADALPLIVTACRDALGVPFGLPGTTIQAVRILPSANPVLDAFGLASASEALRAVVAWEAEVAGGEGMFWESMLANVDPAPGEEFVITWTDLPQVAELGAAAFTTSGELLFEHVVPFPGGKGARWFSVGDLDGDGLDDLAFANRMGLSVYSLSASGLEEMWTIPTGIAPGQVLGPAVGGVTLADFDADGVPEVVSHWHVPDDDTRGAVRIYSASGALLWESRFTYDEPFLLPVNEPYVADIDLDGRFEVITAALDGIVVYGAP